MGGFFWEDFLGGFFGRIFWEELLGRFLQGIGFCQDFWVILSKSRRKEGKFQSLEERASISHLKIDGIIDVTLFDGVEGLF